MISAKQNLLVSFSFTSFQLNGMQCGMVMKKLKLNFRILLLSEIFVIKEDNCCFTDCIKKTSAYIQTFKN